MNPREVIENVLKRKAPDNLEVLLDWWKAEGLQPMERWEVDQQMPLVQWLGRLQHSAVGLLHWPTPDELTRPQVVRSHGRRLELLGSSVDHYLALQAATRDAQGEGFAVKPPESVYSEGDLAVSGLPLAAWILLKGGGDLATYGALVRRHMNKGDTTAALVSAERAASRFAGWAEPLAWRFELLATMKAGREVHDAAVAVMGLPIWTLRGEFAPVARAAGWQDPIDGSPYARLAVDPERLPADRAAHLMDAVAVGEESWSDIRGRLAALYDEAGLEGVGDFIRLEHL